MKIYLASKADRKEEVQSMKTTIEQHGHVMTVDWTQDEWIERPYDESKGKAQYRAERDIKAIAESDAFVLLTEEVANNKGMYVELGAAIILHTQTKKPKVYIIGDYTSHGIFFFHSSVIRKQSIEEVLDDLEG